MEAQKIFKRYEYKYMLTLEQQSELKVLMKQYMIADAFGRSTICNLYFDTPQYLLIRRSIENHVYKEKIRLRTYGQATPETNAFIELKKKYKKVVYKRRISASYEDAMQYLCQRADVIPHSQICSELDYALSLYQEISNIDGAIFAKDDLTINGTGTINVTSAAHGIVCKDDLVVTGGTYTISAEKQGLSGKDSVRIADGAFDITTGGDAIHSENVDDEKKGFVYVANGSFTLNAEGDGISASYVVQLDDGTITISQCYEGLEGQIIDISGGVIDITASDDGLNAAGGNDSSNSNGPGGGDPFSADEDAYINISGGQITIDASGDGIDSNGDLTVSGGTIFVTGPANDGNGAMDYNGTATITGGTVVAAGMSGMAQNFGDDSSQGAMLINLDDTQSGEITLTDADGKELISFTPSREYNSVVISCADLEEGATYTLNTGETATEVTLSSLVYSNGQSQGRQPGGMQNGQMPDQNGQSDSNAPSGQPGQGGPGQNNSSGQSESDQSSTNSSQSNT